MRWGTEFSVSETDALAHRLELSTEPPLDLNSDVIDWLQISTGASLSTVLTNHPSGLAGNLHGAEAMLFGLFPDARWYVGRIGSDPAIKGACIYLSGVSKPFTGESTVSANALLAATLRAFAASQVVRVLRRAA